MDQIHLNTVSNNLKCMLQQKLQNNLSKMQIFEKAYFEFLNKCILYIYRHLVFSSNLANKININKPVITVIIPINEFNFVNPYIRIIIPTR